MAKKILIVDDEETSRRILTIALEGHDHRLLYARDGQEAVDLAVREEPDLIVMDIDLPKMNGYDAARRIKSTPGLRFTKIAAVTARTVQYSEEMARQAGCDDFITKPYRLAAIRERLTRLLGS
ncbi:MAG TPA: response regulator [Candidatus Methanoperedens sp.]|nr:response regulator [Candidatus Methanoperedens sp.]